MQIEYQAIKQLNLCSYLDTEVKDFIRSKIETNGNWKSKEQKEN